jgi:hypothetical protein
MAPEADRAAWTDDWNSIVEHLFAEGDTGVSTSVAHIVTSGGVWARVRAYTRVGYREIALVG